MSNTCITGTCFTIVYLLYWVLGTFNAFKNIDGILFHNAKSLSTLLFLKISTDGEDIANPTADRSECIHSIYILAANYPERHSDLPNQSPQSHQRLPTSTLVPLQQWSSTWAVPPTSGRWQIFSGRSDRNGHWVGAGLVVRWAPENKVGIPKLNREDGNSE